MVETESLNRDFRAVCERLDRILDIIDPSPNNEPEDIPDFAQSEAKPTSENVPLSEAEVNFGTKIGQMLNKTEKEI